MPEAISFTARVLAPGPASAAEMKTWKELAGQAARAGAPLTLRYEGAANHITSYRLYFMLAYAKNVGVSHLEFEAKTASWNEAAREWLVESPADRTVVS